jgi:hypothetical protein
VEFLDGEVEETGIAQHEVTEGGQGVHVRAVSCEALDPREAK